MKCKYLKISKRLSVAAMAMGLAVIYCQAAPVDPAQAEKTAGEFLMSHVDALRTRSTVPAVKTVYTSRASNGENTFFVVNDEEGGSFAIVSADDRLPRVLGWSDKGCFDPDNIPENVKWWLGEYDTEISALLKADPQLPETRGIYEVPYRATIDPMIHTRWNQSTPFNNMCPSVSGKKSVTGCVATAMAQVMRYHEWPVYPSGANKDYTFSGTQLDYNLMIDDYYSGSYTTRQANAVALLMLQCGRSVEMKYSPQESGAQGNMVGYALTTYFDYSQDLRLHFRDYYSASDWEDMVYAELEARRPVLYSGFSYAGGHAFVCDGYLEGYYHFNWGWGGYQDGYFLLNALNPQAGGIGSYIGGYNLGQQIYTGLQKNNGSTDRQYLLVTNGGFVHDARTGFFTVVPTDSDKGYFYNPLSYDFEVTIGVKLVDKDGKTAGYGSVKGSEKLPAGWGYNEYNPTMPELGAGTYRVYPAFKDVNGQWHDIQVVYGQQQYCEATYDAAGKVSFKNPGAPASMQASFVFSDPSVSSPASPGQPVSVSYYVTNLGPGDYTGYVFGALAPETGEPTEDNMDIAVLSLPAGSTEKVTFMVQAPDAKVGEMLVLDEDMRSLGVCDRISLDGTMADRRSPSRKLDVTMLAPYESSGADSPNVAIYAENLTEEVVPVMFLFECFDAYGERVGRFTSGDLRIPAGYANTITFGNVDLELDPGWYFWQVSEMNGETAGNVLSQMYPMRVANGPKTFEFKDYYTIVELGKAEYSRPPIGSYSEAIEIPEEVEGETIVGIEGNAFINSPKLESLTVPASVTRLGSGVLYLTPSLRNLTVAAEKPFSISENLMEEGAFGRVALHTPAGSENAYMHSGVWNRFFMPRWYMKIPADVIVKGLQVDPETDMIYSPYFVSGAESLSFDIELPEGFSAIVGWVIPEKGEDHYHCQNAGKVTLPALESASGSMYIRLVDSASVSEAEIPDVRADVYTAAGVCVLREASSAEISALDKGIYIVNGKKIVIR